MFRLDDIARYLATRLSSLSVFEAWIFSMTVFNTVCVNMVKNMNKCSMYFSSFNGWYLKYRTKPITIN